MTMGTANLRINCSRMAPSAINELAERLNFYSTAQLVGGDLILIHERIDTQNYNKIWFILNKYDVDID